MAEQKLQVVTTESKGKTYRNINLKPKPTKGIPGLEDGNYILVKKTKFIEGQEHKSTLYQKKDGTPQLTYSCLVEYDGQDVSFWLNAKEHSEYKKIGGLGDTIKISLVEEKRTNPVSGIKQLVPTLYFEKV